MKDNVVFLFPGQGAQYPGMGLDLFEIPGEAKRVFEVSSGVLDKDMVSVIRDSDAETLKRSDVAQNTITIASLAAAAYLIEQGIAPIACAGFSVGEYSALCCAGVISLEDCFRLTDARGKAMQAAIDRIQAGSGAPGMAAIVGLSPEQVESLVAEWKTQGLKDLYAANINSSKQVVVSGSAQALDEAEKRFKDAGARRVIRLQVAGPFHSPFMKEAADAFAPVLDKITFNDPEIKLFSNVTGRQVQSGAEAKALARRQIVESVRWTDEEAALAGLKPKALLEVGPGKVLQGLWKDTGSEAPCYAAGTVAEINQIKNEE